MATATVETESTKAATLPFLSDAAWWQVRKMFQTKGLPTKGFDVGWIIAMGLRDNEGTAGNLVRTFKRLGFFGSDGKPTDLAWDWIEDPKYPEVCRKILNAIYPETLTEMFKTASDEDRAGVDRWLQRNLHLTPGSARQYSALYMLLVKADPTEQDAGTSAQPTKSAKSAAPANGQKRGQRPRLVAAPTPQPAQSTLLTVLVDQTPVYEAAPSQAQRVAQPRSRVEPTVNINVQVHIPAEATADQIDQIFASMAKHLWQRDSGSDE